MIRYGKKRKVRTKTDREEQKRVMALQKDWKKKFSENVLERGKNDYENHRVTELQEKDGALFSAAILGRQRRNVSLTVKDGMPVRMSCQCPMAKSGNNCEHMAALLYAIEAKEHGAEMPEKQKHMPEEPEKSGSAALGSEKKVTALAVKKSKRSQEENRQEAAEQNSEGTELLTKRQIGQRLRHLKERIAKDEKEEQWRQAAIARLEKMREEITASTEQTAAKANAEKQRIMREEEEAKRQHQKEEQEKLRLQKEQEQREQEARAKRNAEREKRKAERAAKEAEQKKKAEEERQRRLEQQRAEEARREAIRQQKKEEDQKRREKREQEQIIAKEELERRKKKEEAERKKREREEKAAQEEMERRAQEALAAEKSEEAAQRLRQSGYALLGSGLEEETADQPERGTLAKLEDYHYFDAEKITASIGITKNVWKQGEELLGRGILNEISMSFGYDSNMRSDQPMGRAEGTVKKGKTEFPVAVIYDRTSVLRADCECPECRRHNPYGWYYRENSKCPYVAALLLNLKHALADRNMGDATDRSASAFLYAWQKKQGSRLLAKQAEKENTLMLQPRLVKKNGSLSVSFRFGKDRMFVVKDLDEFCKLVKTSGTSTYGQNTEIRHVRENFTGESRKWLQFVERIVQEETEFARRMEESTWSRYSSRTVSVGSDLGLFGWRLDEFYQDLGDGTVAYEDRDAAKTVKATLHTAAGNPKLAIGISELISEDEPKSTKKRLRFTEQKKNEFHGITVSGHLPELFFGMKEVYYIQKDRFYCSTADFRERIEALEPFVDEEGKFHLQIGRNAMAQFYDQVLPELEEIAEVKESDPERFRSYLPPKVQFVFYLDAPEGDAVCRLFARYEGKEFSVLAGLGSGVEAWRDTYAEKLTLERTMEWLPQIDAAAGELTCGGDESCIYRLMEQGIDELLTMGEVRCTNRFRMRSQIRHVKVSVGVSVSGGLLDLDISTEDVPQEELLDILRSYRTKQSYYRLRDGSYVDLGDSSLEMLSELMGGMNVKPKEFVAGKMHLPLYRTLYLNKMLEENEEVYSERDSHFRKIVKEFKTVEDAEFDVPRSLTKIMRNYQKTGYKWMRTLESRHFGGILADDMGLGKTLQMIAVLLAAKEEAKGAASVSLIITPASLVFNWGEEMNRFAPELKVALVTGTQAERQKILEQYREYDVLVTSYDLLKRDIPLYEEMEFTCEVLDEAQYIKNHTTAAAKAVKIVKSMHRFALTGTPIENRLSELWSIFDYLMPGFLYGYETFRKELELPIVKNQDAQALARLQKMTSPFILRRKKEDVLKDLPEKLEEVRYVRLEGEQQKLYDGQVVHMKESIAAQSSEEFTKNKLRILAELTRLRQICCDPSLCFENYKGEAAKLEACIELIQSAVDGGHRILLFSQFTSMLEILKARLDAEQTAYFTITGSTAKEERLRLVKEFNGGAVPVFLISLKAGGVGLNLTGADVVIHYDPWWNLAAQNQATDRAHRIGQTKKVTVYKLIVRNSIEEKILKLQETKRDLADQVINGENGQLGSMTQEELLELLG